MMQGHLGLLLGGNKPRDDRHTPGDETNPFPFTPLSRLVALSPDADKDRITNICLFRMAD